MGKYQPFRLQKPPSCSGCPLRDIGQGFSEPEGTCANGVALIGEACGEHEAKDGYPFRDYAEGGSLLNRAIGMSGQTRAQFGMFNIIACFPPKGELVGANYEQAAIAHCRVHLLNALNKFQPKAIVAVGAVAARALTGLTGDRLSLEYIRGFALDSNIVLVNGGNNCVPVVPTYHPIFIKRGNWAMLPVLAKDINYVVQVAKYGPLPTDGLKYITDAQPYHLEAMRDTLKANPDIALSTDVETNYAELKEEIFNEDPEMAEQPVEKLELMRRLDSRKQDITQVNLSLAESTGLATYATPACMSLVKEIHALDRVQIGHNLLMFDKQVYEDGGVPLLGQLEDSMWRFHHIYPDLPGKRGKLTKGGDRSEDGSVANLQFCASFYGFPLPWKHLSGSDAGFYGAADADAALRVYWGTDGDMRSLGLLDSYYARVARLMPALERARKRGIPVSREGLVSLHGELAVEIRAIDKEIQLLAPRDILPLHPPLGWKKAPKGAELGKLVEIRRTKNGVPLPIQAALIEIEVDLPAERKVCCMRARKPGKKTGLVADKYVTSPRAHFRGDTLYAPDPDCPKCGGAGVVELEERVERRWAAEMPFNAASPAQMWAYVHYRGYEVKKNSKKKFAMDAETVEKLEKAYSDPLFGHCNRKRKYVKLDSTYCGGWMPGEDGRVHPQIGPYPASGQLAGRKPNPQNCPALSKIGDPVKLVDALAEARQAGKAYEIGKLQDRIAQLGFATRFRNALHAEPGHTIVEGDFSGFHVGTLGYEAGDPTYIRLSKIDIHSFFAVTGMLKLEKADSLLPLADAELKAKLKWYRKNHALKDGTPFETLRNKQAKVAVLAYGLGQGAHSLYLQNTDSFLHVREAEIVVAAMNSTFPKERLYRETQPLTVKPNGYKIVNRFGFVRWFFDVQRYDFRRGEWAHGDDWEAAIAYNVQASAHGHLRECVMTCEDRGYNERYGFDNTVHDSLRYHCPNEYLDECLHNIKEVMEAESEVMRCPWDVEPGTGRQRGMRFIAEFKVGPDWGNGMKEVMVQ